MKPLTHMAVQQLTLFLMRVCVASVSVYAQEKSKAPSEPTPAFAEVKDVAGLPRVLLIGDSISIRHTVPVRKALKGKVDVHRPKANCGPTSTALKSIDAWLGDGKWDVIHFNWGLHDLKYMGSNGENLGDPGDAKNPQQVPPDEYEKNLQQLVERLKMTGAKLIWRNTTPVPSGAGGRVVCDSQKYNTVAAKVMKQHGIEVHDLCSFVVARHDQIMLPADVHFTKEGYDELAQEVAAVILKAIETE